MKNIYLIICLLVLMVQLRAQTLGPTGICSGSNYAANGGYLLSYTVGDMVAVQTVRSKNNILTQGLEQPYDHNLGPILNGYVTPASSTVCNGTSQMFTLVGYHGQNIQWQYNSNQNGGNASWSDFGTNADTATLQNITGKLYVRVIVSSFSQAPQASADAIVMVDSVSLLKVNKLGANQVSLTWQPILGATSYTVHYNGNTDVTSGTSDVISGLSECTHYTVFVTPNTSACSSNGTDTLKLVTLPAPLVLSLTASTGGHINATWTGNTGYRYKLYISTTISIPSYTVYSVRGTSYAVPISSTLSRTYIAYVVVDSGSACSTNAVSNYAYYNMAGSSCTAAAPVITAKSISGKRLSVSWSGSAAGYQFFYKRIFDVSWFSYYTTGTSVTLNVPDACYLVMVVNRCSKTPIAYGYSSGIDTICTTAPCGSPANLVISNVTCRGFNATWNAVSGATYYGIYFAETRSGVSHLIGNYRTRTNSYSTRSLPRNKTYQVFITTLTCTGSTTASGPSNTETVTTLSTACKDDSEEPDTLLPLNNSASNTATLALYPNPSNGEFTLYYNTTGKIGNITIDVVNLLGQSVFYEKVQVDDDTFRKKLTLKRNSAGTYFVRVLQGHSSNVRRIVLTK